MAWNPRSLWLLIAMHLAGFPHHLAIRLSYAAARQQLTAIVCVEKRVSASNGVVAATTWKRAARCYPTCPATLSKNAYSSAISLSLSNRPLALWWCQTCRVLALRDAPTYLKCPAPISHLNSSRLVSTLFLRSLATSFAGSQYPTLGSCSPAVFGGIACHTTHSYQ